MYKLVWRSITIIFTSLIVSGCSADDQAYFPDNHVIRLQSDILQEEREIIVTLPEGYGETDSRYPVIYLLDAEQNIRHASGTADVLTRTGGMPPAIHVGIASADRDKNFTPSKMSHVAKSGGGPKFLEFITEELKPFIEKNFRTHPFSILEGHSLGGTFTVFAMMERPNEFDAYVVVSPALWWNEEGQTERAKEFFSDGKKFNKAAFFAIGTEDGYGMRRDLKRFIEVLEASNLSEFRWEHVELEGEGHMSAPLRAHYFGMKHIFSDMQTPPEMFDAFDAGEFLAHEKRIAAKYGLEAKQTGESYMRLAFHLMEQNEEEAALAVLRRNADAYSKWHMNYNHIGQLQEKMGDMKGAIDSYRAALELTREHGDDWAQKYQEMIEVLEAGN